MPGDLYKLSARDAVALLKKREVSPLELVEASIERIEKTDLQLNAMVTRCFDRARDHARRIMREKTGRASNFLYGLPIGAKDNLDVAGVRSTHGSRIYADHVPRESDCLVQRLEANGAIVMGKTNMPEFGAGGNSFNDVFGTTRNPWDVKTTPGGSSGGSAAALAAGQVWLATGGDFGGSIRQPASFASITGLRPSPGMVAKIQEQPFNPMSVEGPMARNVADVALMFDAQVGFHPDDPLSQVGPHASFAAAAAAPRKPARIAYSADLGIATAIDDEVREICRAAADKIARDGIDVDEKHPDLSDAARTFLTLRGAVYIARHGAWLEQHRDVLKPEIVQNTEFGLSLTAKDVVEAEVAQGDIARRVAAFLQDYDVLVCPTVLCPPFDANRRYPEALNGVHFEGYMGWLVLTFAVTVTACPVMALPVGFTRSGLPVGIQVIGKPRGEAALFAISSHLENLFGVSGLTPIDPR
jgi:amidase